MFILSIISILLVADLCATLPSETILGRQDAICESTTAVAQDPSCWSALGYNTWFETWKGPCPGPPGCNCDVNKPWSDCVLSQYQSALGGSAESKGSCIDLTRPELCSIPPGDWTKLSENQLAAAYVSTAVSSKMKSKNPHLARHLSIVIRSLQLHPWLVSSHRSEPSTSSCAGNPF